MAEYIINEWLMPHGSVKWIDQHRDFLIEVVRCRDCVWNDGDSSICVLYGENNEPGGFCYCGRKEWETKDGR